jgi:hypothetical protein
MLIAQIIEERGMRFFASTTTPNGVTRPWAISVRWSSEWNASLSSGAARSNVSTARHSVFDILAKFTLLRNVNSAEILRQCSLLI